MWSLDADENPSLGHRLLRQRGPARQASREEGVEMQALRVLTKGSGISKRRVREAPEWSEASQT